MEYPNLPERKLIDILANSRASRGTCKIIILPLPRCNPTTPHNIIMTRWSETKPSKLKGLYFHMDEKATDHMVLCFHMDKNQVNLCEPPFQI